MLWIKLSDLVEAQRRQKIMAESGAGGWVTAGAMDGDTGLATPGGALGGHSGDMNAPIGFGDNAMVPQGASSSGVSEGVDAWFAVEPAGAVALQLTFGKLSTYCTTFSSR